MLKRILPALMTPVLLTACWDLPPGDVTSVYYWGDSMLAKYADNLVVNDLEPGPTPLAKPRTVLLVTGVTIREEWFGPIIARLERDGFKPVVWVPPALLSGDLFEASYQLADVVAQVKADSGEDKIDILAECTGGLLARYYLQSLGGEANVSRLVTFVSPQHGVAKAPLAATIAGWPALYDLSPGSDFLHAVNDHALPKDVPITSIYSCTDAWIQPYDTSIIPGATNIGLCDGVVDHFQTFYDPSIYLIMHTALTQPVAGDVEPEPEPTEDPTTEPSEDPTEDPTTDPSEDPTTEPSEDPTEDPTTEPTEDPTTDPTEDPTTEPVTDPTVDPTTETPSDDPEVPMGGAHDDPQGLDNQAQNRSIEPIGCGAGGGSGGGLELGLALAGAAVVVAARRRRAEGARS